MWPNSNQLKSQSECSAASACVRGVALQSVMKTCVYTALACSAGSVRVLTTAQCALRAGTRSRKGKTPEVLRRESDAQRCDCAIASLDVSSTCSSPQICDKSFSSAQRRWVGRESWCAVALLCAGQAGRQAGAPHPRSFKISAISHLRPVITINVVNWSIILVVLTPPVIPVT